MHVAGVQALNDRVSLAYYYGGKGPIVPGWYLRSAAQPLTDTRGMTGPFETAAAAAAAFQQGQW